MNIGVKYDGEYPNLCRGNLIVIIDGEEWKFPDYCLLSGGDIHRDDDCNMWATEGPWEIRDWPEGFPDDELLRLNVLEAVNTSIPFGCCGGCI